MKMFLNVLSLAIVCVSPTVIAKPLDKLSGDSLGTAETVISSLQSALSNTSKPGNQSGDTGPVGTAKNTNTICADLGAAGAYAVSAEIAVRFYTEKFDEQKFSQDTDLARKFNHLIDLIYAARNDFCVRNSANISKLHELVSEAKSTASLTSTALDTMKSSY